MQTPEELRDVYQNFLLYYGHEIPNMRNSESSRPREEGEAEDQPGSRPPVMKQAHRISGYSICLNAKLGKYFCPLSIPFFYLLTLLCFSLI